MAQLELEARRGKLVPIENVAAAAVRCGEMMVKILDQLPNRADDLAEAVVKGGTFSVRRVLKDIACEARSRLATELQKLAEIPEPSEIAEWPKDEETLDAVEQNTRLRFERLAEVPT